MSLRYDSKTGQWVDADVEMKKEEKPLGVKEAETEEKAVEVSRPEVEEKIAEASRLIVEEKAAEAARITAEERASQVQPEEAKVVMSPIPEEPQKKKSKLPLIIACIVILLGIVGIAVAAAMGVFENPSRKILSAMKETFKDESKTVQMLQQFNDLTMDTFALTMDVDVDGDTLELKLINSEESLQLTGSVDTYYLSSEKIDFQTMLTENQATLKVPYISDYVFVYNYRDEKTGFISELASKEDIEIVDLFFQLLYDSRGKQNGNSIDDEMTAVLLEEYLSWEFEKIEAREFRVNGEQVKCKGYQTTITAEQLTAMVEKIEAVYVDNGMDYWNVNEDFVQNPFEDLYSLIDSMWDMKASFYLTEDQVACIILDVEDEALKISFKGGENGMQDIEVELDSYTILEIDRSVDDTKEDTIISLYGAEALGFYYDSKSGDFELAFDYDYSVFNMKGAIKTKEEEFKMSVDSLSIYYEEYYDVNIEILLEAGAELETIEGEEFDIGSASESELEELVIEVLGEDFDYGRLLDYYTGGYYDGSYDDYYNDYSSDDYTDDYYSDSFYEEFFYYAYEKYGLTPDDILELSDEDFENLFAEFEEYYWGY